MKKSVQLKINKNVIDSWEEAMDYFNRNLPKEVDWVRLRSCQAYVYETTRYIYLRSYGTIVAFIDKEFDVNCVYDGLRYVYGYTATSAQHIAKFRNDYAGIKYGWTRTYYPV